MSVRRIRSIALVVRDLAVSRRFYVDALGFTPEAEDRLEGEGFARLVGVRDARADRATLRLGRERIELVQFATAGAPYPQASASPDLWFQHFAIVVSDIDAAHARLRGALGFVPISEGGPQRLPARSGGVAAFKFRDPDGHPLELLAFPPDAAPARWRQAAPGDAGPFLGIDHSAIAVADTARAEAFYVSMLGLAVGSRSLNRGPEQERLDGTFNAVVEVTGLRLPDEGGPHLELLCYRVPPTGRPIPVDARANDIAATRLRIACTDLEATVDEAVEKRLRFVSPGIVVQADGSRAVSLRDIDGHLLELVEGAHGSA